MKRIYLDHIARLFPRLNIIGAHFGNPWWEEAWTMLKSNDNIYADLSGGTVGTDRLHPCTEQRANRLALRRHDRRCQW